MNRMWVVMEPWRKRAIALALVAAGVCALSLPAGSYPAYYTPSRLLAPFLSPHNARTAGATASIAFPILLLVALVLYGTRPKV